MYWTGSGMPPEVGPNSEWQAWPDGNTAGLWIEDANFSKHTWFVRCVQEKDCDDPFYGESNLIKIEVLTCQNACIEFQASVDKNMDWNCYSEEDPDPAKQRTFLTAYPSGGTYQWGTGVTPVPGTNEGDIIYAGSYYVTVTKGGCTDIASVTVIEDKTEPNVTLSGDEKLTCANDYMVTLTVNTGSFAPSELAFAWTNATPVAGKPYQATVSSQSQINVSVDVQNKANGCIKQLFRSVELGNNIVQVPQIVNKDNDNLHCENTEVELEVQPQNYGSYEWQDDEGNILGEEKFLTVTKPGQYKVIVTDAQNGCMASATIFVGYSSCSNLDILNGKSRANNYPLIRSIGTHNEERGDQITKKISVWPNPTKSSTFRLDFADFHGHHLLVHIFDMNGTPIYSNEFTDVGEVPYTISVQNIRNGQYTVHAIVDGKSYVMTRFIVQYD